MVGPLSGSIAYTTGAVGLEPTTITLTGCRSAIELRATGGQGFEPQLPVPKTGVLPLHHPPLFSSQQFPVGPAARAAHDLVWPAAYSITEMIGGQCVNDSFGLQWAVQDSNLRPSPCKGDALPTELTALDRGERIRTSDICVPNAAL